MSETPEAGGTTPDSPEPHPSDSPHDQQIDEFLFKKELDEVYLLLDFISGRTDKDLSRLAVPDPVPPADATARPDLSPRDVMRRLSLIRYPPTGTRKQNADDAALLMLAKDRLTALASPARGITIAYTVMFTEVSWIAVLRGLLRALFWPVRRRTPADLAPAHGHRFTLAANAFPGLVAEVDRFVLLLIMLLGFSLVWLLLTGFTYWDVAIGRSIAQRIDQIHIDRYALYQANPEFTQPGTTVPETDGDGFAYVKPKSCGDASVPTQHALGCWKLRDLAKAEWEATNDLAAFKRCTSVWCVHVLHPVRWGFVLCGVDKKTMKPEQSMVSVISIYSNYVLPMMFGVLGTLVMAFRSIQGQVRDSTLSPRELWNTLLALPLGIVAGLAVGLFYSPSAAPAVAGADGLAANLSLTTCGLGFLAGYGSNPFFNSLDSILKSVFHVNGGTIHPPAPPALGTGQPSGAH
jgi:hypothetical protein